MKKRGERADQWFPLGCVGDQTLDLSQHEDCGNVKEWQARHHVTFLAHNLVQLRQTFVHTRHGGGVGQTWPSRQLLLRDILCLAVSQVEMCCGGRWKVNGRPVQIHSRCRTSDTAVGLRRIVALPCPTNWRPISMCMVFHIFTHSLVNTHSRHAHAHNEDRT